MTGVMEPKIRGFQPSLIDVWPPATAPKLRASRHRSGQWIRILDADRQGGYRRQVEFYQWLLRGNGLRVSDRAWFVYANGIRGDAAFYDVLHFRTKLLPYDGDDGWVEPTLRGVADCLASGSAPDAAPGCAFCEYVARASAAG